MNALLCIYSVYPPWPQVVVGETRTKCSAACVKMCKYSIVFAPGWVNNHYFTTHPTHKWNLTILCLVLPSYKCSTLCRGYHTRWRHFVSLQDTALRSSTYNICIKNISKKSLVAVVVLPRGLSTPVSARCRGYHITSFRLTEGGAGGVAPSSACGADGACAWI